MSPRGSPLNKDYEFAPSHPVVRTHPVTGWKSVFAGVGLHVSRINDVYNYEDQIIRDYVMRLITDALDETSLRYLEQCVYIACCHGKLTALDFV